MPARRTLSAVLSRSEDKEQSREAQDTYRDARAAREAARAKRQEAAASAALYPTTNRDVR